MRHWHVGWVLVVFSVAAGVQSEDVDKGEGGLPRTTTPVPSSSNSLPTDRGMRRTAGGIHLPLYRRTASSESRDRLRAHPRNTGAIGLGDYQDVTYSVLIQFGETHLPVVLDTGSSDLWVLSTSCQGSCSSRKAPLYPLTTFHSTDLDASLVYGDSMTGTHATGLVGFDTVSVAGIVAQNQYFAAINNTNTSVMETDSSGIFGLGFPINSVLWMDVYMNQRQNHQLTNRTVLSTSPNHDPDANVNARFPDRLKNLVTRWFPKNNTSDSTSLDAFPHAQSKRQTQTSAVDLSTSFATIGPLIPRLVAQGGLNLPMFTVTLQRDTIQVGGNEGVLSIGELPPTVKNESLTWVPVRGYTPQQGGLRPPIDAPSEVYPIAWEIPVDDVYFDGVKLPRSRLSSPTISLSALIDTGNSLIRGPPDVISYIQTLLGGPRFACSPPHTLSFQIGGKQFPVDPRDFVSQVRSGDPDTCSANLAPTDVPATGGAGYLYSWNLGDPFLKSVLAAFYYGSLARPSQGPPRIGLLSTVESNAGKELCDDKHVAENAHADYPGIVEPAPASVPPSRGTGIGGVPLAPVPTVTESGTSRYGPTHRSNGVKEGFRISLSIWTGLVGLVGWIGWRTIV